MKQFFSSLLISFALLLLIPTVSAIEPPTIGFTFVDGLGDPISSPIRIRVSLWSVPDITTTDFQGSGALETASSAYADYQTTLVVNPVSTGYFRLDLSTLAGFPALTDSNKYLQVEWKSPPTGTPGGYAIYDFSRDVSTARDRIPLILENGFAYEDFLLSTEDYDFDIFQETADTFTITFGNVLGETLIFDNNAGQFSFSNHLSLQGAELRDARIENLSSDPATCDAMQTGRMYFNTTDSQFLVCNGTSWAPLGGYMARKIGFVSFPASTTGLLSITGVGFQSNFLEFTLNSDVELADFDSVSPPNNNTEQGSFGWGKGYAYDNGTSIEQQAQFFSASSNSINAHRSLSSSSSAILIIASNQNGVELGRIEAQVTGFTGNGFTLNVISNTLAADYVMMYEAQALSANEIVFQDDGSSSTTFTIDQDNVGTAQDVQIVAEQGTDNNGILRYNATNKEWEVSNDGGPFETLISGDVDAQTLDGIDSTQFLRSDTSDIFTSGTLTFDNGTTIALAGTVNIGDGGDDVFINSNDWDISSTGLVSGLTGITSTGSLDFSNASQFFIPQGLVDPGSCVVGSEFYNLTTNQHKVCTSLNAWSTLRRDFFGTEYQYAESEGVSTTNSTNFQQKLRLTTTSLPAGTYRIGWSYQWNHDSSANDFEARVQLDDSQNLEEHVEEPQDSGGGFGSTGSNQQFTNSGFQHVSLSTGVHTVDIDYRTSDSGGDESSIWNARLEIWRVQ